MEVRARQWLLPVLIWTQIWYTWAMKFEDALKEDMFQDLTHWVDPEVALVYDGARASQAFMLDQTGSRIAGVPNVNVSIKITGSSWDFEGHSDSSPYLFEISLMIVKLKIHGATSQTITNVRNHSQIFVEVQSGDSSDVFQVQTQRLVPESISVLKNQHIFRTWTFDESEEYQFDRLPWIDPANKTISIDIQNFHINSSIYLVATLHKRVRDPYTYSQWRSGCPNSHMGQDFGCEDVAPFQVCIPQSSLTCDFLPNCGQPVIPNADENCSAVWSFKQSLLLLVYTLSAISAFLIIVGCIRACIIHCPCTRNDHQEPQGRRRSARFIDYISNSLPRRPRNAPPTYDDAIKNDGFVSDETPPPSYSQAHEECPASLIPIVEEPQGPEPVASASGRSEVVATVALPPDPPAYEQLGTRSPRAARNSTRAIVEHSNVEQ